MDTTKFWALKPDPNNYQIAYPLVDDEREFFRQLGTGERLGKKWHPPEIDLDPSGIVKSNKPVGDSPALPLRYITLSQRAVRVVMDEKTIRNVELLPLRVSANQPGPFYIMNMLKIIDAIDRENSDIVYSNAPKGRISYIRRYALFEDRLVGEDLFGLKDAPHDVYITNKLKLRIEEAGLDGFQFFPVNT